MQDTDRDPIVAICLLAALADGDRSPEEQAEFQRIADRLGRADTSALTARAHQGSLTVQDAVAALGASESRKMAYEMAASVVYADGQANAAERDFLADLRRLLELPAEGVAPVHRELETLALAPLAGPLPDTTPGTLRGEAPRPAQAGIPSLPRDAALDELIRKQALLTGALELLPQTLATVAIIPLQMRLVYRIGTEYGHTLDPAQIKDLLGAMGIDALGYAARQYYAQGRQLSRGDVQALFQRFRTEAEALLPRVQEEIHQQAQHLDLKRGVESVRGT